MYLKSFPMEGRDVYYTANPIAADNLALQRTRASAAMALTKFASNISILAPIGKIF